MDEQEVLTLIKGWQDKDPNATQVLMEMAYETIHKLSHEHRNKLPENANTQLIELSATDFAHEAYLRFSQASPQMSVDTVREFYQYLNSAVRNLYVDRYRKFADGNNKVDFTQLNSLAALNQTEEIKDNVRAERLVEQIEALYARYPRQAETLELRYFAQRSNKEIARLIGVSLRTVENDIRFAKAWLSNKMS